VYKVIRNQALKSI